MKQFLVLLCCLVGQVTLAQISKVYIAAIDIEGNKKTKSQLIRNELNLTVGDSLPLADLMPMINKNERYLFNTGLFISTRIKIVKWEGTNVHLKVLVEEAWYIVPIPQFELADRNFNVWWVQQNRDLRRANIGLWFFWRNVSGYNDLLKTVVQFGYTRKFELDYYLPPMGRKRKFGFLVNALYSDNKEINYTTAQNQPLFYNDYDSKERQFSRLRFSLKGYYRRRLTENHQLGLTYLQLAISKEVLALNTDFFGDNRHIQRSFQLQYSYTLNKRDIQIYPLQGYYIHSSLTKQGLGVFQDINQLQWYNHWSAHIRLHPDLYWTTHLKARYNMLTNKMPYYDNRALGYEDIIRGYQYYTIDGQSFGLIQSELNFRLVNFEIPLWKKAPISYLQKMPIKLHFRYHVDVGYVWDRYYATSNPLSNSSLVATGVGLDIILYNYNVIFQIEYSVNKSGENGLYLRYKFHF